MKLFSCYSLTILLIHNVFFFGRGGIIVEDVIKEIMACMKSRWRHNLERSRVQAVNTRKHPSKRERNPTKKAINRITIMTRRIQRVDASWSVSLGTLSSGRGDGTGQVMFAQLNFLY